MIVAIQQPEHLPWIGFFNKMAQCDQFVLLDHVQFKKNYFENRNRIKTSNGPVYLTVPVRMHGRFGQTMLETEVAEDPSWVRKYLMTIEQNYRKTPYFGDVRDIVWPVLEAGHKFLLPINLGLIENIKAYLGIGAELVRSSTMKLGDAKKADLVLEVCKHEGAAVYISGPDGRNYLNMPDFASNGIKVVFHDYAHPSYAQRFDGFVSHLSVIDIIANCGLESVDVVKSYKMNDLAFL